MDEFNGALEVLTKETRSSQAPNRQEIKSVFSSRPSEENFIKKMVNAVLRDRATSETSQGPAEAVTKQILAKALSITSILTDALDDWTMKLADWLPLSPIPKRIPNSKVVI